jgi:hypothetical protein
MKIKINFFIIFLLPAYSAFSQIYFQGYDSIPVSQNNHPLEFPWAGGLHNPQFSEIDLNGDSVLDLFVNERWGTFVEYGNKHLTFINNGIFDSVSYTYAPEYESKFPYLKNWTLLRDFNCDGKTDIFTSIPSGVALYKNESNANGLSFSLYKEMLFYNSVINVYVSSVDIPAIDDIDGDGDLDIVTFDILGGYIDYFLNGSMETYNHCDSLNFTGKTGCWGFFYETYNCGSYYLADTCYNYNANDPKYSKTEAHSGSTVLSMDMDGDEDKDILLGDVSCHTLSYAQNGGTKTEAYINHTDSTFPGCDIPVHIDNFPASFAIDANNDGKKDLIVAPNVTNGGESLDNCWYYKNIGPGDTSTFEFQNTQFIQQDMIDVGQNAYPAFVDYNADSLIDLVIGNYAYYSNAQFISSLTLYENTGTLTEPQFTLISRDWLNSSTLGLKGLYPTFGDIDSDGDLDMILGEEEGNLHLFTNSAGIGKALNLSLTSAYYQSIDLGKNSAPQLVDVDRDNLLDLIIGNKTGYISYYKNTGSLTTATFTLQTDSFGDVNVQADGYYSGYSTPFLCETDSTHQYYLFVGSETGKIAMYDNIDNNLTGKFTLVDSVLQHNTVGSRTAPALADIDHDNKLEMMTGNFRGGLSIFKQSDSLVGIHETSNAKNNSVFIIYPNPAKDIIYIKTNENPVSKFDISVYNALGQLLKYQSFNDSHIAEINISYLSRGLYFCKIKRDEESNFTIFSVVK